jgi:hypothetical protein
VFGDQFENTWQASDTPVHTTSTDQWYDGSTSLRFNGLGSYGGFYIGRGNAWNTPLDAIGLGFTHLEFKARIGPLDQQRTFSVSIGVRLSNDTYISLPGVDMSSPVYSNEQPTTANRWSVIRVPLSELGLESGMSISGMYIAHRSGVKLLECYIDGIQLASYTTTMEPIPNYGVSLQYDVPQSPFDGSGPGAAPTSAGGAPSVSSGSVTSIGLLFFTVIATVVALLL